MQSQNRLRGLVATQYGSVRQFAAALGWNYGKAYRIVTGTQEPDATDINEMADALRVTDKNDIVDVFILPYCSQNANN